MTEEEWLSCKNLWQLFEQLDPRVYDRKLRLFAAACCRQIWDRFPDELCREVVELSEKYADQHVDYDELASLVAKLRPKQFSYAAQAAQKAAAVGCASYRASTESYLSASFNTVTAIVGTEYINSRN